MSKLHLLVGLSLTMLSAQDRVGHLQTTPQPSATAIAPANPASDTDASDPLNYILGPNDVVTLYSPQLEEVSNKPLRIDMHGDLNIPLAGRIHAAGLTVDQVEAQLQSLLKKYVFRPAVIVNITEYHSQPVSVLGAVMTPGVHQLEGDKNLFEVISSAGGLRPDSGNTVTITRDLRWGSIPLPNAHPDITGHFSVASVSAKSIVTGINPAENIPIKPHDVVSVSKADVIYCIGSVHKPGGFVVGQQETLSALQVISLAEGLDSKAAPNKARIMRQVNGNATRTEIPVDLKKLLAGKMPDLALKADDILFVPASTAKAIAVRTGEAAMTIGTSIAIYAH